MLRSMSPGELTAAISGLCALAALGMRIWGRVVLAREQRRALAVVVAAARHGSRAVAVRHEAPGTWWSLDIGTDRTVAARSAASTGWAAAGDEAQ